MLLELISSCGLDFDCLKIAILSLAHRAQLLLANIFAALVVAFGGVLTTVHCAKSYRPFELFANENHKLRMN